MRPPKKICVPLYNSLCSYAIDIIRYLFFCFGVNSSIFSVKVLSLVLSGGAVLVMVITLFSILASIYSPSSRRKEVCQPQAFTFQRFPWDISRKRQTGIYWSCSFFVSDIIARHARPIPSIPIPEFTSSFLRIESTTTATPIASAIAFIII